MKMYLILFMTYCLSILASAAQVSEKTGVNDLTYELYSWQGPDGDWNFRILPTTDRQKTVAEVFSHKSAIHGIDQLKRRVSELPISSDIVWFDRLTLSGVKVKGSERLKYPPKKVVDEVRNSAKTRNIRIDAPDT